jgi:3-oxoacyl-[acyl-carrier protein] reductase
LFHISCYYLRIVNIDITGKTALVCGSSSGIGRAIALELAASGARVILLARNREKLQAVCESLANQNLNHQCFVADFENNAQVEKVANEIVENHSIDILINNTGGPPAGPAHLAKTNEFITAFQNHLINNHILVQAVLPAMKENRWGRIVNVISTSVKIPLNNLGVSNTIRGAVGNWAKTLANELGPFGITVNNVLPGATETERLGNIISGKSNKTGSSIEAVEKEMLHEIPAGRFGKPEEIAFAACFLASDKSAYINGTNVVVDGGRTGNL